MNKYFLPSLTLAMIASAHGGFGTAYADANPASSRCEVAISIPTAAEISGYNALRTGDYAEAFRIHVENNGTNLCAGLLKIKAMSGSTTLVGPGGTRMQFRIVDKDNVNNIVYDPARGGEGRVPVQIERGGKKDYWLKLYVPGGQPGNSGRYVSNLDLSFEHGNDVVDTDNLPVAVNVIPTVQANFTGVEQSGDGGKSYMDFGNLTPGLVRSIGLQVRSNSDVDVEITSDNRGNMRALAATGDLVPYSMSLAGRSIALGGVTTTPVSMNNSVSGQTFPMVFTIGSFSRVHAGEYKDTLLFRISAR